MKRKLYCTFCNPPNWLATQTDTGVVVVRHRRVIQAALPVRVTCEKCGNSIVITEKGVSRERKTEVSE